MRIGDHCVASGNHTDRIGCQSWKRIRNRRDGANHTERCMLDHSQRAFRRLQPQLSELSLRPSEYIRRQVKFSPFAGEPVGWMIEQAGDELFAFASDYPHHEGTDDPIRRFDQTLEETPAEAVDRFYRGNFEELMGL